MLRRIRSSISCKAAFTVPPRYSNRQGNARRIRRNGVDRDADRKVLARTGEVAAPLVVAPIEQEFGHPDATDEHRSRFQERREKKVIGPHGAADRGADRLLPVRRSVGAEAARPLQRNRLGVENPRQDHIAI